MDPDLFGLQLVVHDDIDPSYFIFAQAYDTDPALAARLFLAHMLFYDLGTSFRVALASAPFWTAARRAVPGTGYRRGRERRHFRGQLADKLIGQLEPLLPTPAALIAAIRDGPLATAVPELPGFGAYFRFKIGDIAERAFNRRILFDVSTLTWYPTPRKSAEWFAPGRPDQLITHLLDTLSVIPAPPRYDRPVNIQEIETVLCDAVKAAKRKSYVGRETDEMYTQLAAAEPFLNPLDYEHALSWLPPTLPDTIRQGYWFHHDYHT